MLKRTLREYGKYAFGLSRWGWPIGRRFPTLVGVDIGSRTIKLLELRGHSRGYTVVKCGIDMLAQGGIPLDNVEDKENISACIRRLAQKLRISGRAAAVCLSAPEVFAKRVTVPRMSVEALEEYVEWESRQYLPAGLEDACVDFHILPDGNENRTGGSEQTILLVAAKSDSIERKRHILEAAGLVPMVLDMTGLALCNGTATPSSGRGGAPTLVVNCGMRMMNMAVIHQGVPLVLRDVPLGGGQLIEMIRSWKHCTAAEAEQHLFHGPENFLLEEEWDRLYAGIIGEARRTLDCCGILHAGMLPRQIVLFGGLALAVGIQARFRKQLGLSVEVGNPFSGMDMNQVQTHGLSLHEVAPLFGVAVGLAKREKGDR